MLWGMICIDAFSKNCASVPIKGRTESDLALGSLEWMHNMDGPPKLIITDGETGINA